MSRQDLITLGLSMVVGAAAGWALGSAIAILAGIALGAAFGAAANRARIRPAIAIAALTGAFVGVIIGRSIVRVLCLPGTCVGLEGIGAVLTGVGAFIGVGLLAALVTRSFDEYHESVASGRPPPTPGCETDEPDPP